MDEDLNPILIMLKYPPVHDMYCPIVYYGFQGMSQELYNELAKECKCNFQE